MSMSPKFVLLWTDITIWVLVVCLCGYAVWARRSPTLRSNWRKVFQDPAAMASSVILVACLLVTLLDSIHFRRALPAAAGQQGAAVAYDTRTRSVLDVLLVRLIDSREATYSLPLATVSAKG